MAKSGLMLGLGETDKEIKKTLVDLKHAGSLTLTLGQYLAPSKDHVPVARYVSPEEFEMLAETAYAMGFISVASGPLVRSSYRASEMQNLGAKKDVVESIRNAGRWDQNALSLKSAQGRTCTGRM
jgi:lipoic acid synthetase